MRVDKVDAYNKQDSLPSKLNISKDLRGSQRWLAVVEVEYNKTGDINTFTHIRAVVTNLTRDGV